MYLPRRFKKSDEKSPDSSSPQREAEIRLIYLGTVPGSELPEPVVRPRERVRSRPRDVRRARRSYRRATDRISEYVDRVEREHERVVVTRNGRPAVVIEFVTGALVENPQRVGRELRSDLAVIMSARRGTFVSCTASTRFAARWSFSASIIAGMPIGAEPAWGPRARRRRAFASGRWAG